MKIYTRTGDAGDTGLYGGQRVRKDDARVEAYGTLDEANAALGLAAAHLPAGELRDLVTDLQRDLFTAGADLATPLSREDKAGKFIVPRIEPRHVAEIEAAIDRLEERLPALRVFILPGGSVAAACLHLARGVIRRAERRTVSLHDLAPGDISPDIIPYLNRVADLLFVLARAANREAGTDNVPWTRGE